MNALIEAIARPLPARDPSAPALSRWIARLRFAVQVWRERRQLAVLDDRQLADVGIHPNHARIEVGRGFFDLPDRG